MVAIPTCSKSPRAPSRPTTNGRARRNRSCRNTSSSVARRHGRASSINSKTRPGYKSTPTSSHPPGRQPEGARRARGNARDEFRFFRFRRGCVAQLSRRRYARVFPSRRGRERAADPRSDRDSVRDALPRRAAGGARRTRARRQAGGSRRNARGGGGGGLPQLVRKRRQRPGGAAAVRRAERGGGTVGGGCAGGAAGRPSGRGGRGGRGACAGGFSEGFKARPAGGL